MQLLQRTYIRLICSPTALLVLSLSYSNQQGLKAIYVSAFKEEEKKLLYLDKNFFCIFVSEKSLKKPEHC